MYKAARQRIPFLVKAQSEGKMNQEPRKETSNAVIKDLVKVFLLPTLINKFFMLYFGLNYSEHPGEGYGYGLVATLLFLAFTIGRFLWKYKDIEDP
jgi:hypothetical protein